MIFWIMTCYSLLSTLTSKSYTPGVASNFYTSLCVIRSQRKPFISLHLLYFCRVGLHSSVCGIWHALDWHTWWHSLKWNDFKIKRSNNLDILYSTCILCSYIKASHRFDLMMQDSTLWYFWDGSFSLKSTCIVFTCFSISNTGWLLLFYFP